MVPLKGTIFPQLRFTFDELLALVSLLKEAEKDPCINYDAHHLIKRITELFQYPSPARCYKGMAHLEEDSAIRRTKISLESALLNEVSVAITY